MYRYFLIIALLNFADSADLVSRALCRGDISRYCRPSKARYYGPPHNYYHGSGRTNTGTTSNPTVQPLPPANTFEDLAQNLAAAESAVRKFCSNNSNIIVKDVFGTDAYILKYALRDYKESNINVKIKHETIYVTANQAGWISFKDLRILPSIVNTRLAWWVLENNYLKIVIPYKVAFRSEAVNKCGDVNDALVEVPAMKSNNLLQYRTNDDNEIVTEENIQTSTSTVNPATLNNKDSDVMTVDDAMAIIFPED